MIDDQRLYQALGERLRGIRMASASSGRRLTQADLASLVGLERTSITNIENGTQKVPLHTLMRICESLGTSVCDVIPSVNDVRQRASRKPAERDEVVRGLPLVDAAVSSVLKSGQ